jgi:hypothetical protein
MFVAYETMKLMMDVQSSKVATVRKFYGVP